MKGAELLNLALKRANLQSDYALHKATGITQQIISGIRNDHRHPSVEEAVKLATLAGLQEIDVIADIELQTAKTPQKKKFWKSFIESRNATTAVCTIAIGTALLIGPDYTETSILQLKNYGTAEVHVFEQENIHYAQEKNEGRN